MRRLVVIILAALIPAISFAWGPKGHDIVAYVAEQHLSKRAKRNVEQALGGYSMVYVANWMDNASHTDEYEHTKTWHYVNVDPEEVSYARSKKEDKGDVVTAVNDIIKSLKCDVLTPEQERVKLMMLIHLVGDMHCPMHAGHKRDKGGNGTKVKYFGKQEKLHSVWDSKIVESAHNWSYTEWQREVDRLNKKQEKRIVQGTPNNWIEECVMLADDVYARSTKGGNLSYDYVAHYTPIVEQQLLKAGIRLAKILEEIY